MLAFQPAVRPGERNERPVVQIDENAFIEARTGLHGAYLFQPADLGDLAPTLRTRQPSAIGHRPAYRGK
jgi:hypothetical protein